MLSKTQHVKVWLSYAQFEANNPNNAENNNEKARIVFKKAYDELKNTSTNESRVMVLEAWKEFELNLDEKDQTKIEYVSSLMPKQIRKRRKIQSEDGVIILFLILIVEFQFNKLFPNKVGRWMGRVYRLCISKMLGGFAKVHKESSSI